MSIKADILAKAIKKFLAASGPEDKALEHKLQAWSPCPLRTLCNINYKHMGFYCLFLLTALSESTVAGETVMGHFF